MELFLDSSSNYVTTTQFSKIHFNFRLRFPIESSKHPLSEVFFLYVLLSSQKQHI